MLTPRPLALRVSVALLAGLPAASCRPSPEATANGDDPLAALTVSTPSTKYTAGFWREQARTDPQGLWSKAVAYCGDPQPRPGLEQDGAKPNCQEVRLAAFNLRNERAMEEVRARNDARQARERAMTPAQRQAEFEKNLFKP